MVEEWIGNPNRDIWSYIYIEAVFDEIYRPFIDADKVTDIFYCLLFFSNIFGNLYRIVIRSFMESYALYIYFIYSLAIFSSLISIILGLISLIGYFGDKPYAAKEEL